MVDDPLGAQKSFGEANCALRSQKAAVMAAILLAMISTSSVTRKLPKADNVRILSGTCIRFWMQNEYCLGVSSDLTVEQTQEHKWTYNLTSQLTEQAITQFGKQLLLSAKLQ